MFILADVVRPLARPGEFYIEYRGGEFYIEPRIITPAALESERAAHAPASHLLPPQIAALVAHQPPSYAANVIEQ